MKLKKTLITSIYTTLKLVFIALFLILVVGITSLILSLGDWQDLAKEAISGRNNLESGLIALENKNWSLAITNFENANENFIASDKSIQSLRISWFPAKLKLGAKQLNNLEHLNASSLIIARSALQVSRLVNNINPTSLNNEDNFQSLSLDKKAAFLQSLIALEPELNGLKANLSLALIRLESIPKFSILWPIKDQLKELKAQLELGRDLISKTLPIVRLLPAFSGYPEEVHYLIMFQNNDELRPTGGFLGSYARLDIANFGEIKKLEASDIYHLDMPSIGKTSYEAPAPITKYLGVENWYLRDSNWSPDWPTAAKQIENMFQAESIAAGQIEPELNGVLAITPDFVANLLRITGPITIRGEVYAPENMQALLQYNVEIAYREEGISSWDRKEIINELITELEKRLVNLPLSSYPELINRLSMSLERKDLLLYFNNPAIQSVALSLGGAGEIKNTENDYFMVVDANLAAFKSDAVVRKNIYYKLKEENNRLKSSLKLNYYHEGDFDWRTTRYRSYTRILAPLGAELISIEGLNMGEADLIDYDDYDLNKKVFGFFWTIEPGKNKELNINYYLPNNIKNNLNNNKEYDLYVQRQPGSRNESLNIAIELNKDFDHIMPDIINSDLKQNSAYWTDKLERDKIFKVIFK
jgi:hypothetical protein